MKSSDRLLPSRIREHLGTPSFGRRIYYYPETDSTNRVALDLARAGESSGTLVVTDHQTRGRGRRDHQWSSREGEDLLFTVILRPESTPVTLLPLTLVFSVVVAATLTEKLGVVVSVKWPNDMVTRRGKIGGVLAEGSMTTAEKSFVVVGTGLNVNSQPDAFPDDLRRRVATCRAESGRTWNRAKVLADVLEAMERGYRQFLAEGFAGMRSQYEESLVLTGRRVSFLHRGRRLVATVEGVEDDGALRVAPVEGDEPMSLYSEEVNPVA